MQVTTIDRYLIGYTGSGLELAARFSYMINKIPPERFFYDHCNGIKTTQPLKRLRLVAVRRADLDNTCARHHWWDRYAGWRNLEFIHRLTDALMLAVRLAESR